MWDLYAEELKSSLGLVEQYSDSKDRNGLSLISKIYNSKHCLRSRETYISDEKASIYNNIVYPKTGRDLPCLGMDLMAFSPKKVIIVFDFQHPKENHDYNDPLVRGLMGHYLDNTTDTIRFFEPGNHFSRYIFVRKCIAEEVNNYLDDFKTYVRIYSMLLKTYNPSGNDYGVYKDFDNYMRKLDPVEGYLAHKFDKEFAKQYVEEFLFPLQ
jgi:hypothetical protein